MVLMNIGEIIKDQQVVSVEFSDRRLELQSLSCGLEPLDDISGAGEQHAIAILDQCAADGRRAVTLARAWRSEQQQVCCLVEPGVAGGQGHDARLAEHRHGGKVEVVEGLARWQPCFGEVPLDPSAATLGNLQFGEYRRAIVRPANSPCRSAR